MKNRYLIVLAFASLFLSCDSESASASNDVSGGDGQGGSLARFTLVGDFLYTVDDQALNIFDITDPAKPAKVGEKQVGFDIETLYSLDEYLFIGSRLGMFIYDVSDPKFPLKLSEVQHVRSCDPVVSSGDYTYVTLHTNAVCLGEVNQLEVYDTQNLLEPKLLTTVQMDWPIGLGLYHNYLLVTDLNTVRIFDVSEPEQPDLLGGIEVDGFDLIIREDHLFIIGDEELRQYELNAQDITNPVLLGSLTF